MLDPATITKLAAIAHSLWCAQMARQGWRYGRQFDPGQKAHDALVPFEQLTCQDKRHACLGIEAAELERALISAIDYQRGPDREFTAAELRAGLEVAFADPANPRLPYRGRVESWETDATGELIIRVRWDDGQRSEHLACARELTRIELR